VVGVLAKSDKKNSIASEGEHEVDLSNLDSIVGYGLRRALAKQRERFRAVFSQFEIRPIQFAVLILIRDSMPVRQAELGRAIAMKRANVVTVLDELIDRGLVVREQAEGDRRANVLTLTPEGIAYTNELQSTHAKLEQDVAEQLGQKNFEKLVELLRAFRQLDGAPKLD
jgi:DNA-binding MarR family transcriptional regulator